MCFNLKINKLKRFISIINSKLFVKKKIKIFKLSIVLYSKPKSNKSKLYENRLKFIKNFYWKKEKAWNWLWLEKILKTCKNKKKIKKKKNRKI